jgi:D-beta-D-heptose 7-phosphate kinase/D-beta-D-heptose 1-phosphate adenosyltransferase
MTQESKVKTIFTNGCFDILHRGHIELFKFCRSLGNNVIVGLNTDRSIRENKGNSRPINSQEDRKLILESIRYIDNVILFDEKTPYKLINQIKPDIIVKGGDYSAKDVVGSDICKVVIFDYVKGYSTTRLLQDITDR